jgi:hypothetical protein
MKLSKFFIVNNLGFFISAITFGVRSNVISQIGMIIFGILLFPLLLISIFKAFFTLRKNGIYVFVVPITSIILSILAVFIGHSIRFASFKMNLNRYQSAVEWVLEQDFPQDEMYINLTPPSKFSDITHAIHAKKSKECGIVVWFFWGSGFPVRHTVRIFTEQDSISHKCYGDYYNFRKLEEHWYEATG